MTTKKTQSKYSTRYCKQAGISDSPADYPKDIQKLGEFYDVYCVATTKKPVAALDFSAYGRKKLKKSKTQINKLIEFCNKKGVQMIHNKKRGGMYLKTVFFLPKNYQKAIKLMYVLWAPPERGFDGWAHSVAIGLLLGYSTKDIMSYQKHTKDPVTLKNIQNIRQFISPKNWKLTFKDLPKEYTFEHKKTIPRL